MFLVKEEYLFFIYVASWDNCKDLELRLTNRICTIFFFTWLLQSCWFQPLFLCRFQSVLTCPPGVLSEPSCLAPLWLITLLSAAHLATCISLIIGVSAVRGSTVSVTLGWNFFCVVAISYLQCVLLMCSPCHTCWPMKQPAYDLFMSDSCHRCPLLSPLTKPGVKP